jgi:hypothetical protein
VGCQRTLRKTGNLFIFPKYFFGNLCLHPLHLGADIEDRQSERVCGVAE